MKMLPKGTSIFLSSSPVAGQRNNHLCRRQPANIAWCHHGSDTGPQPRKSGTQTQHRVAAEERMQTFLTSPGCSRLLAPWFTSNTKTTVSSLAQRGPDTRVSHPNTIPTEQGRDRNLVVNRHESRKLKGRWKSRLTELGPSEGARPWRQ